MDPAAIYAITLIYAGIGSAPTLSVERLPPQWTMADCIKDHEQKLAGRPHTKALCVSRDRFRVSLPPPTIHLVSIRTGSDGTVDSTKWPGTMDECRRVVARFANQVKAFCIEVGKVDKSRRLRHG